MANTLQLEAPDTKAFVHFLDTHLSVSITVENGQVVIEATAFNVHNGEPTSTWEDHSLVFDLPEPSSDDE